MGLFSFIKSAGEKLFGGGDSAEEKAQKIVEHLNTYNFDLSNISVSVEDEVATLSGEAVSIEEKRKILVATGNVEGISEINDALSLPVVEETEEVVEEPVIQHYTVERGDYLSKISKQVYGDANKYNIIFEANKPMLTHPDKIYPGQVLVIPPVE